MTCQELFNKNQMTVLDRAEGKVDTGVYGKKNHESWLSDDYLYYMPELSLWYIGLAPILG